MSIKITLQILGSLACAGTVTTGLVFGAPKLKSAFHFVYATDGASINQEHKNNPPRSLFLKG